MRRTVTGPVVGRITGALACAAVVAGCTAGPSVAPPTPVASSSSASAAATAPVPSPAASAAPSPVPSPVATTSPSPSPPATADQPASASARPSVSPSPSPSPSTSRRPTPVVPPPDDRPAVPMPANPIGTSPLNGLPIGKYKPVLVMKLDNTRNAQPHAGLIDADIVYLEEVEYGITRIAAVFSSRVPDRIGPVRSARITDLDLFAQYGKPAFGYSGAQRKLFPYLKAASIYDVSPYTGGGYTRDTRRHAPYNLYVDGRAVQKRAARATPAHDMGFVFDDAVPLGGLNATKATMAWGYASAGFAYDKKDAEYVVSLNGEKARAEEWSGGQRAATVVIQYVKQTKSQFWDKGGGNTPHAQTIGTGKALVLRDGRMYTTTWHRPNARSGTTFRLRDGTLLPFKPGQLWVVLLDRTRKATVTPLTKPKEPARPKPTPTASPTPTPSTSASTEPTGPVTSPSPGPGPS